MYSFNRINKKIIVIGICPPPLGGIAIHIQRVIALYKKQQNAVGVIDISRRRWYHFVFIDAFKACFNIMYFRPHYIDYHTAYTRRSLLELNMLLCLKILLRFKITIVEHDCRYLYHRNNIFKKIRNLLNKFIDHHVLIGNTTYKSYLENNISLKSYSIESAFLPPDTTEEVMINAIYPVSLQSFMQSRKPLILVNAFELILINSQDLYGIDMCLELIKELKTTYRNIGLLIVLSQIGNDHHFKRLNTYIKAYNLNSHIYFLINNYPLWPLFKYCTIFVRPTFSDSFGISVAEALYFQVPAIASDVCIRQKGAILFKTGNFKSFYKKVYGCLNSRSVDCD